MAVVFHADDLQITDDWIRSGSGTFAIRDVRSAWVTRRQNTRGSRLMTAALGVGVTIVLIGGAGWLTHNWLWLLASPVFFLVAAWAGVLDPVAIYLEKRHHELWIATDTVAIRLWKANKVEVHKALRAIQRAREREREQFNF